MSRMINRKKEKSILEEGKRGVLQVIFSRTMLFMVLILLKFAYMIVRMYAFVEYIPVFLGSEFIVVAIMMLVILNSKENPMIKLSWCILVGLFPIFGSVIYLFIGLELGHRLQKKRIFKVEGEYRAYLPELQIEDVLKEDSQTGYMAKYLREYADATIYKDTEVAYFPIGELQFEEMKKQLELAKEYIFLEYFMIAPGVMWSSILDILIRKAKEGVEVRLLYDGSCSVYLLPYNYPERIQKSGIKCRMFSPPVPFLSTHYNNRDHRKIMVIDGKVAFTGGINLCDEYINVDSPCGHWKDVGIMLKGGAVRDFLRMFLEMWAATERKPVIEPEFLIKKLEAKEKFSLEKRTSIASHIDGENCGYVIPFRDSPVDKENIGEMVYLDILNQAKDYVYIMTPYLILDNEMLTALSFAAKRGVDVRIILPHIPDKRSAFALAQSHYKELLEAGIKIYEYTPGFVHAKVFLCDGCRGVVGTINLDYRSLYLHYECAAYLYKVSAIKDIYKDFQKTLELCQEVTMTDVKNRGVFTQLTGYILKVVAPLM